MAATNRPDVLDPALTRPGRFDRHIVIQPPDVRGREAILQVHARGKKLAPDVDLGLIARITPMFNGADRESLLNEAALIAVVRDKKAIETADIEEARDKVLWGKEKRSYRLEEEDRKVTACHESGHALLAHLLPEVDPLHKVTIIPRGHFLGAAFQLPEKDIYRKRRTQLLGDIQVRYGGRIAEELFFSDISTGAQQDLREATGIARRMVCEWGMSEKLGPLSFRGEEKGGPFDELVGSTRGHSEATAVTIDAEIRRICEGCYKDAKQTLEKHRADLERISAALFEHEVLNQQDVEKILRGEPLHKEPATPDAKPAADDAGKAADEEAARPKPEPDSEPPPQPAFGA